MSGTYPPPRAERSRRQCLTNLSRDAGEINVRSVYCPGYRCAADSAISSLFARSSRDCGALAVERDIGRCSQKRGGTLDALGRRLQVTANGVLRRFTKCCAWED